MAPPIKPVKERLLARREIVGSCWLWTGCKTKDGYGVIGMRRVQKRVHRVAFEAFHGKSADGFLVCHSCDTPLCFNPDHLFLGSERDNMQDMLKKGRKYLMRGSQHTNSKLTEADVAAIKRRRNGAGETLNAIAADFGITFQQVSRIARGTSWNHM